MTNKKYLLADFGDSGIRYAIVTETDKGINMNKIKIDTSAGSAPLVGNKSNAYIIRLRSLINNMKQLISANDVTDVVVNLPATKEELIVMTPGYKGTLLKYINKNYKQQFDTSKELLIAGEVKTNSNGTTVVPVAALHSGYSNLLLELGQMVNVKVTSNLLRLTLISQYLQKNEEHAIIDMGYTGTRIMVLDENSVPLTYSTLSFCGRDAIDCMNNLDYKNAVVQFNQRINLTDETKNYINTGAKQFRRKIRDMVSHESKIVLVGGLASLSWDIVLKDYTYEVLTCSPIAQKDAVTALTVAPMLYSGFTGFDAINLGEKPSVKETDQEYDDTITEEEYYKRIKTPTEETLSGGETEDNVGYYSEEFDEYEDEEEEVQKPSKYKRKETLRRSKPSPNADDDSDDILEDEELEEEIQAPPKKRKRQTTNPKRLGKKHKAQSQSEEDNEDFERSQKPKKKSKKNAKPIGAKSVVILMSVLCCIIILSIVSYKAYISYLANNKEANVQVSNEERSIVEYVAQIVTEQNIEVASAEEKVDGNLHHLLLEVDNTTKETINQLASALTECNVSIVKSPPPQDNPDGTKNVVLDISFK